MDKTLLNDIAKIRLCVGFLGEAEQSAWWPSSFFSSAGTAFLSPVFSKTCFSAQYYGIKKAATIVHDEHIGIGKGVFHLFRLPETQEIEIHNLFVKPEIISDAQQIISDKSKAQDYLDEYGKKSDVKEFGPVLIGDATKISKKSIWQKIALYYANAFKDGNKSFPYFSTTI
jgi:hypothetical protein